MTTEDALWAGRTFRAYREFSGNTVMRLVATKKFRLSKQSLYLTGGRIRVVVSVGGTPGGTWTPINTIFSTNVIRNRPLGMTADVGGTITGGTEREVLLANADKEAGEPSLLEGARILPAGTYYFTLTVTGTTSGIYAFEGEELE